MHTLTECRDEEISVDNRIRIGLEYSFRGETYSPSATIDLDILGDRDEMPDWHTMLAAAAGIDTYSYAYEVMRQSPIRFSQATGLAAEYLHDDEFDFAGFVRSRRQADIPEQLRGIASDVLQVNDLDAQPALAEALLQAYRLGRASLGDAAKDS